jgi:hypothetical protein
MTGNMQDASIADAIVKRKWLSDFQREGIRFNDTLAWCVSRYSYGNAPLFAMPCLNALSKTEYLPRQARDKPRERWREGNKKTVLAAGSRWRRMLSLSTKEGGRVFR